MGLSQVGLCLYLRLDYFVMALRMISGCAWRAPLSVATTATGNRDDRTSWLACSAERLGDRVEAVQCRIGYAKPPSEDYSLISDLLQGRKRKYLINVLC